MMCAGFIANGTSLLMSAKRLPVALFSALIGSTSLPAVADLNANLGLTSEYVREGISQTRGNITWQAGLTWQHNSGVYAGAWGSGLERREDNADAEADIFAGFYQPLSDRLALDVSATRFTFHGDNADEQNYDEFGARLLLDDSWVFGWRHSEEYLGTQSPRRALELSYTLHRGSFAIEFFGANYRWLELGDGAGYGDNKTDDYWHFRIGVERTWNRWDYRLLIERTGLGSEYDAGTQIQFGVHRYFNLW